MASVGGLRQAQVLLHGHGPDVVTADELWMHTDMGKMFCGEPQIINRPLCASGVGDGCAALAEGTSSEAALIKDLQAKSAAKKERRAREAVERYSVNNFGDYFSAAFPPKALVRHADGTYEALTQDVVAAGLKNGTIARDPGRAARGY
ncbi:hypothetical protein JL720_15538 [Aureococcus anophagefferens]|nr:hypothetical protein JL720_15538 [Aureococcus anophagefferens]